MVVMMLPVLRRRIIMVIIIRQRVMRAAICHSFVMPCHMPGGKEPAEQCQQSENAVEWAHGEPISDTVPSCQQRSAS